MDLYTSLVRPLLFRFSADRAHEMGKWALRSFPVWRLLASGARFHDPRLETDLAGIRLRNPIGLAPGFDKNGDLLPGLMQLGFGFIVVGSITREPRVGNPYPRLVRYPEREAIANSLGMPNVGIQVAVHLLAQPRPAGCPVIANIAGFSAQELLEMAAQVEPYVDAVEIGLVCPNTTETERMQEMQMFTALVDGLRSQRRKPVFIKLPRFYAEAGIDRVRQMIDLCAHAGLEGVSINASLPIEEPRLGAGRGSIAGRPTFDNAMMVLREIAQHVAGRLAIKAGSGVFTGADAAQMLRGGATAVELYTAFIYRGWNVAGLIKRELLHVMEQDGVASVDALRAPAPVPHHAP